MSSGFPGGVSVKVSAYDWDNDHTAVMDTLEDMIDGKVAAHHGKNIRVWAELWQNKRSGDQNDKMQAMIRHINHNQGWGLSQTNAKNIITAECFGSKVVNGHEVYCSTSKLNTQQMSTLIEWMQRYCDENGIPLLEGHS